jgi:hypothetical protein
MSEWGLFQMGLRKTSKIALFCAGVKLDGAQKNCVRLGGF